MEHNTDKKRSSFTKNNNLFGTKFGFLFCLLSILSVATVDLSIEVAFMLESVASMLSGDADNNIGIMTFYLSLIGLLPFVLYYIWVLFTNPARLDRVLVFLLLACLFFLPTALFYKDWLSKNFRMDAQQGLGLMIIPIIFSWIYPVLGIVHDTILASKSA